MAVLKTNTHATSVERLKVVDKYGKPSRVVVARHVRCWFELSHRQARNTDGDIARVDALLMIESRVFELDLGDVVKVGLDTFEVVTVDMKYGVDKKARHGEYDLVKKQR